MDIKKCTLICRICKKEFDVDDLTEDPRNEPDKIVRHKDFGITCACHTGVVNLYESLTRE